MTSSNFARGGKIHHIYQAEEAAIETITNDISSALAQERRSSEESLKANRAIGDALIKAKPLLSGKYVKWAKENFDFTKQWCARLTKLAQSWTECEQARAWAREQGRLPGNAYSVDGALALTSEWRRAVAPEPHLTTDEADKVRRRQPSGLRAENDDLCAKLAEVSAENDRLKAQLAQLTSQIQEQKGAIFWNGELSGIDQSTPAVPLEEALDVTSVGSIGPAASCDDQAGKSAAPCKKATKGRVFDRKLNELFALSTAQPFAGSRQEIDLACNSNEELIVQIGECLREYVSRNALVHFLKWKQSDMRFSVQVYSAKNVEAYFQLLGRPLPCDELRLYVLDDEISSSISL